MALKLSEQTCPALEEQHALTEARTDEESHGCKSVGKTHGQIVLDSFGFLSGMN